MRYKNKFFLAAAGAGKTTKIVNKALSVQNRRVLITTYTRENTNNIIQFIEKVYGIIPPNIKVKTWFSFLLTDCIRPYQSCLHCGERIENINFTNQISNKFVKKSNVSRYYFTKSNLIYSDKISEFAVECNKASSNKVVKRLEQCFDDIFIDEAQDFSGYDFDLIELLLDSKINVTMVGDSRQNTYSTSASRKNQKYSKDILAWFSEMQVHNKGELQHLNKSHRCNQYICDFADDLFPGLPKTISTNGDTTDHDGIFYISSGQLSQYYEAFRPQILIYDKRSEHLAQQIPTINFGESKGRTFDRVIIIANGPIGKFLETGDSKFVSKSLNKFYVAITRARYSVAFLCDKTVGLPGIIKYSFN